VLHCVYIDLQLVLQYGMFRGEAAIRSKVAVLIAIPASNARTLVPPLLHYNLRHMAVRKQEDTRQPNQVLHTA